MVIRILQRRLRTTALIDSGADLSFLPYQVAAALKVTPPTFETTYQAAGLEWPAGDLVASVDVFLSGEIFHIPAARFLVPKRENDLPFVVLGQEPLFAMAEVRFRGWEARVGIRPRPKPWQETVRGPP